MGIIDLLSMSLSQEYTLSNNSVFHPSITIAPDNYRDGTQGDIMLSGVEA